MVSSARNTGKARVGLLAAVLVAGLLTITGRLYWVQVLHSDRFVRLAADQRVRRIDLAPQRGSITDRNGSELAISADARTIYANPRFVTDPGGAAAALAPLLGISAGDLHSKLDRRSGFVYLARKADPEAATKVAALKIPGVASVPESRRLYPSDSLAAQVLGFVGTNNQGLAGLESKYDSVLSGSPGQILTERDPQGRKIPAGRSFARPAVAGRDLVLTLDAQIQFEAERLLAEALKKWRAKSGTAVVMDPRTGEVLALANAPSFDPNNFREFSPEVRRNRAVMDVYEPGSANKAIVAAAAIESGLTSPQEVFSVPDVFRIADKVFKDSHPHPTLNLTFSGVIERSSNVGTIKVAQRLGRERLYEYLERFGYGKTTGLGFPGESPGILPKTHKWWTTSMGSIPIGHGVATTTMQIIDVFAAIANRGELVSPKLVKGFVSNGKIDHAPPSSTRRVINEQTARTVTQMLLEVTEGKEGTGVLARVPGFQIAGKTGTAQKPLPNGKGYEGYVSSFIGFAPAGAPRLVAGVVLDDPKPIWGGVTAAVTFQQLMEFSLRHLGIGPGPVLP